MTEQELNELTGGIIGVAIEVHRELGPGLLEKVYQRCLKVALEEAGYTVQMELLMNFNVTQLKQGIKRIKNGYLPL